MVTCDWIADYWLLLFPLDYPTNRAILATLSARIALDVAQSGRPREFTFAPLRHKGR